MSVVRNFLIGALTALLCGSLHADPGERMALVIGNSAYPKAPLTNPRKDARDMTSLLRQAGFTVDQQLDTTKGQLSQAVARFGAAIKDPKVKFALFYYAGHGLQQEWRNYLVPVSADIRSAADVKSKTVDVSELLAYMEQAKGRSFLVILDACRDDPFAGNYRPPDKGLTQFDAPVGSLLAYATAPGSVAQDGDGENGLYTGNLLREFAVRGARLEDAFKRVRLNVRLASQGMQVPWESTSLEDDLYLFPSERMTLTDAEQDQLLEREISSWTRVRSSNDFQQLAGFIREYPSGSVSELAQARLNRLLAAQSKRKNESVQIAAATTTQITRDVLVRVELAGQQAAQAEAQRLAAEQAEQSRRQAAVLALQQQEAVRAEAASLAAQQADAATLAQRRLLEAQARAAELDAQRVAARAAQDAAVAKAEAQRMEEQRRESLARAAETQAQQAAALRAAQQVERLRADAQRLEAARIEIERVAAALDQERMLAAAREEVARAQARAQAAAAHAELVEQESRERALAQTRQAEQAGLELTRLAIEKELAASRLATIVAAAAPKQAALEIGAIFAATPYFKGSNEHQRSYQTGDQFNYQVVDGFTKASKPLSMQVTAVDVEADRVEYNNGEYVSDTMGNTIANPRGGFSTPRQFYPAELFVGKKWRTMFKQSRPGGIVYTYRYDLKVVGRETIVVPAGTFDTFKIEARGFNMQLNARLERNIWVAPGVSGDIAHEIVVRLRNGVIEQFDRQELVSFRQAALRTATR
ncbi:MAG: caspase family protein [Ramlibacter sp.]|nr:caspase family protein [Ramlibacter sp.]